MLFEMAYHSQGGFQWADLYDMPIALRRFYYDKLVEAKTKEKEDKKPTSLIFIYELKSKENTYDQ